VDYTYTLPSRPEPKRGEDSDFSEKIASVFDEAWQRDGGAPRLGRRLDVHGGPELSHVFTDVLASLSAPRARKEDAVTLGGHFGE
jgi:hypothetical protein